MERENYFGAEVSYHVHGETMERGEFNPCDTVEQAKRQLTKTLAFFHELADRNQVHKADILCICKMCDGRGKRPSKRNKYKSVRCPACRGKEPQQTIETWIDLPRSAWL